jgi:hypothetical protein
MISNLTLYLWRTYPQDYFEMYQERAAIHQYEGGFSMSDAERMAAKEMIDQWVLDKRGWL